MALAFTLTLFACIAGNLCQDMMANFVASQRVGALLFTLGRANSVSLRTTAFSQAGFASFTFVELCARANTRFARAFLHTAMELFVKMALTFGDTSFVLTALFLAATEVSVALGSLNYTLCVCFGTFLAADMSVVCVACFFAGSGVFAFALAGFGAELVSVDAVFLVSAFVTSSTLFATCVAPTYRFARSSQLFVTFVCDSTLFMALLQMKATFCTSFFALLDLVTFVASEGSDGFVAHFVANFLVGGAFLLDASFVAFTSEMFAFLLVAAFFAFWADSTVNFVLLFCSHFGRACTIVDANGMFFGIFDILGAVYFALRIMLLARLDSSEFANLVGSSTRVTADRSFKFVTRS